MNIHVDDLKRTGIQASYQRVRILEFLRTCSAEDFEPPPQVFLDSKRDYHPTVEQIHGHLAKDMPTLSKTTVYNTLKLFAEQKLISSVDQHGALRYDRYPHEHAHLLCGDCGALIDWEISPELQQQLSRLVSGTAVLRSWQLVLGGTCPACCH